MRIFVLKRADVTGGWRKLHNEELHNLYISPDISMIRSRTIKWERQVVHMGEMRNAYKILAGKCEGNRPLARLRRRWDDDTKTDVRETMWHGVDWIHLTRYMIQWWASVNLVMNLPYSIKGDEFHDQLRVLPTSQERLQNAYRCYQHVRV
jgi:hypothetical protein